MVQEAKEAGKPCDAVILDLTIEDNGGNPRPVNDINLIIYRNA